MKTDLLKILAVSITIAGCGRARPPTTVDPAMSMVGTAETAVTHDLRDPESTHFRDVRIVNVTNSQGSAVTSVCGELNAKNEMGGYVGYTPFLYVAKRTYGKQEIDEKTREYPIGDVELVKEDEPQHRKNVAALCMPTQSFPEGELTHPFADTPPQLRALVSR